MSIVAQLNGLVDTATSSFGFEILIFGIFTLSFFLWTALDKHYFSAPKGKVLTETEVETEVETTTPFQLIKQRDGILTALNEKQFTKALNKWRHTERLGQLHLMPIDADFLELMITQAIRVGKLDVVEVLLGQAKSYAEAWTDVELGAPFWQRVCRMLAGRRQFAALLLIWREFGAQFPADKVALSCMINAALELKEPAQAASMLSLYKTSVPPLQPREYNVFYRTYVQTQDWAAALALYDEMRASSVTVETLLFNLLLLTLVKGGQVEKAIELTQHEGNVDTVSFNTLLKGVATRGDVDQCLAILNTMREREIAADEVTQATVLDACAATGDEERALATLKEFTLHSTAEKKDTAPGQNPSLLLKGLLRVERVDQALSLYADLARAGQTALVERAVHGQLMRVAANAKNLPLALEIAENMKKVGQKVDDVMLTHLIDGCWQANNATLGDEIFANIVATGVVPNVYSLTSLLKMYGRAGRFEDSVKLVKTWEAKYGSKVSIIHMTCLMAGACRARRVDVAWQAYQVMKDAGIALDEQSVRTLLPALTASKLWAEAVEVATHGLPHAAQGTRAELLNSLLEQLLRHGMVAPDGHKVYDLMVRYQVVCTVRNAVRRLGLPVGAAGWQ